MDHDIGVNKRPATDERTSVITKKKLIFLSNRSKAKMIDEFAPTPSVFNVLYVLIFQFHSHAFGAFC